MRKREEEVEGEEAKGGGGVEEYLSCFMVPLARTCIEHAYILTPVVHTGGVQNYFATNV